MLDGCIVRTYNEILRTELMEATGCTEPIALALAAAKARSVLGCLPDKVEVYCSANIIKNVKAVVVPNSGGLKGIETAAMLGIVAGNEEGNLQVISNVTDEDREKLREELALNKVSCFHAKDVPTLYIRVVVHKGEESAEVVLQNKHDNISSVIKNGEVLYHEEVPEGRTVKGPDKNLLNVKDILEYAETVNLEEVRDIIARQIEDNVAISQEGLKNDWGERVGKTLISCYGSSDIKVRARAAAAAGSDARMNGCPMPVVINSGSGNQGMTVSLPVIEYAKELKVSDEKLYRALILANLIALHQKRYIGYLSAYCGAVSAGTGAGCGICWMLGGGYQEICDTITNSISTISGMICDGAKSSCAGKIALSVESAIQAMEMAMKGFVYRNGEGLVKKDCECSIKAVGKMAKEGMASTDNKILEIMLEN